MRLDDLRGLDVSVVWASTFGSPMSLIRFFGRGGVDPDVCVSAPDDDLERVAGLLFALAPEVGDCVGGVRGFAGEPGAGVLGAGERRTA